jgi:large subunit ribosomal protein L20
MTRAKSGTIHAKRRRKVLKAAKGFIGGRHRLYRTAKDSVRKAYMHAFADRRRKKRSFRGLWIMRINAACRMENMSYSTFMHGLKEKGIDLDRKVLSQLAVHDLDSFKKIVNEIRG